MAYYFNKYCGKCYYCRNGKEHMCTDKQINMKAMGEYIVVNEQQVYKLDDDADLRCAALIEPISICIHGIDLCNIRPGVTVAISGGGGIGQICMQLAKMAGAVKLTLIEPVEEKRKIALACGAEYVIDPVVQNVVEEAKKITGGLGYDVVIEASGAKAAMKTAYQITGMAAVVEYIAVYPKETTYDFIDTEEAFFKELTVIAGVMQSPYTIVRSTEVYKHLQLEPLMSIYQPEQCEQGVKDQRNGKSIKTVFEFG